MPEALKVMHHELSVTGWGNPATPTLMPSNLERALSGLRARRVLRDLMAPNSENPTALAIILTSET